jgi:hypothetical protein
MLRLWAFSAFLVVAAAVGACRTDYQEGKDDPAYGGANALANQEPPGVTSDAVSSSSSSGGTPGGPPCGTPVALPAGCTIKFADVITALRPASCGAGVSCHGAGGQKPIINFDDPATTYTNLTNFPAANGKWYVSPCSTDPAESAIVVNIDPAAPDHAGNVMPPSVGFAAGVQKVTDWVKCGSPQ